MQELPNDNELIPLSEAAKYFPGRTESRRVCLHTLYRWIKKGVRGVRLRVQVVGYRQYCTTRKWIREFTEATNKEHPIATRPHLPHHKADEILTESGI